MRYDYARVKIICCHGCGLWRTCPRLTPEELTAYYEKHYYSEELQQSGRYEEWRDRNADVWRVNAGLALKAWRGSSNRPGDPADRPTLLDVGCGHGFFLEQALLLGMQARGIEVSPQAVRYARGELQLEVREMPLDELPADERYDIITLWGVLEHVPQPLRTMEQVRAHLKSGGMTWVMTPNTNALERFLKGTQYFNFLNQSHLTHFHARTLRALLERASFTDVRRHVHWGGGGRRGFGALAQYAARWLCLGTELRFVARTRR